MLGNPFPLAPKNFFPRGPTYVGYQPTGIKPLLFASPGSLISKTARQLLSALAMYSVFSSGDKASPLVVEPVNWVGYNEVEITSVVFPVAVLIRDTELSLALATNKRVPFLFNSNSLGWLPTVILLRVFV